MVNIIRSVATVHTHYLNVVQLKHTIGLQVLWLGKEDVKVTWEPASSLPQAVVSEFSKGVESTAVEQRSEHYGQETYTFLVKTKALDCQTQKKSRIYRPVVMSNDG